MDRVNNFLAKHSGKIKYLFLLGAIIASFNTLGRADYNFILYLYMFYVWTFMESTPEIQSEDKLGTFYLLLYSLFIDLFWCLFWGGKWDDISTIVHEFTLFFSWIGIILKACIASIIGILEWEIIKASLVRLLRGKQSKNNFIPFNED